MSIELKNVTYTYSPGTAYEIHALKDINLSIPDGQFIGSVRLLVPLLTMERISGERNMTGVPCEAR